MSENQKINSKNPDSRPPIPSPEGIKISFVAEVLAKIRYYSSVNHICYICRGPIRAFSGHGICYFFRRDIGILGLEIAGNGIGYTKNEECLSFYSIKGKDMI